MATGNSAPMRFQRHLWKLFNDSELNQYEDRAMANNQPESRDCPADARRAVCGGVTASGLFPELDAAPERPKGQRLRQTVRQWRHHRAPAVSQNVFYSIHLEL